MKLNARLQAMEQSLRQNCGRVPVAGVCDRIEELTRLFEVRQPTFSEAVEAGILAAANPEERAWLAITTS